MLWVLFGGGGLVVWWYVCGDCVVMVVLFVLGMGGDVLVMMEDFDVCFGVVYVDLFLCVVVWYGVEVFDDFDVVVDFDVLEFLLGELIWLFG